jgi:hypothetical protein
MSVIAGIAGIAAIAGIAGIALAIRAAATPPRILLVMPGGAG